MVLQTCDRWGGMRGGAGDDAPGSEWVGAEPARGGGDGGRDGQWWRKGRGELGGPGGGRAGAVCCVGSIVGK